MKTVLVTGAASFIGRCLIDAQLEAGNTVHAIVSSGSPIGRKLKMRDVKVVYGDIHDYATVQKVTADVDIVYHCDPTITDWTTEKKFQDTIISGTRNICRAAAEADVEHFIFISTHDVFGYRKKKVIDENSPTEKWQEPYPDKKIKAGEICKMFHKEQKLPLTTVYPCWVYGEYDYSFTTGIANAILKKRMFYWRKNALIWPTYIRNLIDLLMYIPENEKSIGNDYLIHDGTPITVRELCKKISTHLELPVIRKRTPYLFALLMANLLESVWRFFQIKHRPILTTYVVKKLSSYREYSIKKVKNELKWQPKISSEKGLSKTMNWMKTVDRSKLKPK